MVCEGEATDDRPRRQLRPAMHSGYWIPAPEFYFFSFHKGGFWRDFNERKRHRPVSGEIFCTRISNCGVTLREFSLIVAN